MSTADRLRQPGAVIGVTLALTAVALVENTVAPWAPFYVVYMAAATVVPLVLGTYAFGSLRDVRWWHWVLVPVLAVLMQVVAGVLMLGVTPAVLGAFGVDDPAALPWSYQAALQALFEASAARLGGTPEGIGTAYLVMVVAWAGLGEELLYRGYVHGTLRPRWGLTAAIAVSATLFAVRHMTQLALVTPYPWGAAAQWVVLSLVMGVVLSLLYEWTRSLWIPVCVHYAFNLIPLLGGAG